MELPIPSGIKTEIPESANLSTPIWFLTKYRDILNISQSMIYNKETKEYELNTSDIELSVTLDTVDKIKLFSQLLEDVKEVSKDKLKEVSFRVDEEFIQYVKELNIDDDIKKNLIKKSKDRAFFDMLLINALKD